MSSVKTAEPWQTMDLHRIAETVETVFQSASVFEVNYAVRSHVEDFLVGLDFLDRLKDKRDPELKLAARKLCELSREIRFASTYPDCKHKGLKDVIEELFLCASDRLSGSDDEEVKQYRQNIIHRTQLPMAKR